MSGQPGKENTEPDNLNVGLIATITVVGALLVVAIAAALTALVRSESMAHGNEIGAFANLGAVKRLKEEQHGKLEAAPGWSDRSKGLVSLPIDRAMGLVTADLQKNPYLATPSPPRKDEDAGAAAAAPGADGGSVAPAVAPSAAPAPGEAPPLPAPATPSAAPSEPAAPPASAAPSEPTPAAPSAAPSKE